MKPRQNMVKYLERLTVKEKAVIVYLANHLPAKGFDLPKCDFHQGLVPFLPVSDVIHWLKIITTDGSTPYRIGTTTQAMLMEVGKYKRIALGILTKMQEDLEQPAGQTTFLMVLNATKVFRKFGPHPERGKPLPFLPKEKVTVGMKWSLPKKTYVNDEDVLVSPCVSLRRVDKAGTNNLWQVVVSTKCRHAVENWLLDQCG